MENMRKIENLFDTELDKTDNEYIMAGKEVFEREKPDVLYEEFISVWDNLTREWYKNREIQEDETARWLDLHMRAAKYDE